MDWFERLTGFPERDYESTSALLDFSGGRLTSKVNGQSYGIGHLEVPTLAALRELAKAGSGATGSMKVGIVTGDVGALHRQPEFAGALFQVASQFNLLEMTSPRVTPEDGVTRYRNDPTQGPACAIAAGCRVRKAAGLPCQTRRFINSIKRAIRRPMARHRTRFPVWPMMVLPQLVRWSNVVPPLRHKP